MSAESLSFLLAGLSTRLKTAKRITTSVINPMVRKMPPVIRNPELVVSSIFLPLGKIH